MNAVLVVASVVATLLAIPEAPQGIPLNLAGRVLDARTGAPLSDARVRVQSGQAVAVAVSVTDMEGRFHIQVDRAVTLVVERAGYAALERTFTKSDTSMIMALFPLGDEAARLGTARSLEGLTITTVRAGAESPVAEATLGRSEIERDYAGQDIPLTLRAAPSITAYTESGSLLNYSYFRLRGIDQSRINMTLDGVPLNEPEDQQLYFSDFPDLTSSVSSIQVQRGTGTSSFGQAAFGGSVNFATQSLAGSKRGASVRAAGGSFGTAMAAIEAQSGQTENRMAIAGRFSGLRSDGYRDGSASAANSAWLSAGFFGDRDLVKFTATTGLERNGQAYQPATDADLRINPRHNPLAGVGDHYRLSLAMLSWTRLLSPDVSAGVTAYGFGARGWYDYPAGVPGPALRFRTASRWAGLIAATRASKGRLTVDAGAHGMTYSKDHEFDGREDLQWPGYSNTGFKTEGSAFAKVRVAAGRASLFGDLQLRTAEFRYRPTAGYGLAEAGQRWSFVNPKAGVTWSVSPRLSIFTSLGTTGREPTRGDLLAGADDVTPDDAQALLPLDRVRPEHVTDFEVGASFTSVRFRVNLTGYDMRFRDEIARTGATTPLGYDLRANVGRSYRRGVEVEMSVAATRQLDADVSFTASRNRINSFTDEGSGVTYRDVAPILTPSFIASHALRWQPVSGVGFHLDGRYQGRTWLAPRGDRSLTTPPFHALDGGLVFEAGPRTLRVQVRNLLNRRAYPSGDVSGNTARYFILAPRSVDVTMRFAAGC